MIDALRSGPACLAEGFRMLLRPGLRRYVVLPLLGNIVILLLASLALFLVLDSALEHWLPQGADWLRWLLFPLLAFALVAFGLFAFSLLANLLLGPFLGSLAAQVRRQQGLAEAAAPERGFWAGWRHDFGQELRRLGYVALCLLGVFVLGWIPVVQILAAPLGLVVGAWLLALEYAAHSLALDRLDWRGQLDFMRANRLGALAFGGATMAALLVPVLNLFLLPAAVIGATLWVQQRRAAAASGLG